MPVIGGRIDWNESEWRRFISRTGPAGRNLGRKAEIVTQGAKRRCPVSPAGSHGRPSGYARSQVGWRWGEDEQGLYADIVSSAQTVDGKPLGLFIEVGTDPHPIVSKGPYPLRNARTGQVFGRSVQHPGTPAQPHLRPALDDIRGMR